MFEHNMQFLSKRAPDAAQKIMHAPLEGFQAEYVQTKTSVPSLRVIPDGAAAPVLLHSAYDPMREASRWAEGITVENHLNIFLLGIGLGYQILTFLQQHAPKTRFLFIVEQDPRIARIAMSTIDFRPVINREGTFWLIGEEPEDIPDLIGEKRTDIILHNFRIFSHDASLKSYPAYYESVQRSLLDAVTYDEVNLRTNMENRGRNQFNILMNLPSIYLGSPLHVFKDAFRGYPGIVSAAGPSLDKNIDQIVNRGDHAPLFVVDTAQKTYQNRGIQPDFVVTADPTPLNYSHFEKIDSLGDAFLAFHPEVNRKITEKFVQHPHLLPLFDGESDYLEFLFDAKNRCGTMDRAMNVGHIAFNLAVYMGCDPIILIGFDYAFPPKGGMTHTKDAAMSRDILDSKADGTTTISGKEDRAGIETGRMNFVNGYYGDRVLTTTPFVQYIHALERSIKEYGVRVIDATEGGAAFQQTTRIPLAEALSSELKNEGISTIIQNFRLKKPDHDFPLILKKLEESKQILVDGQKICEELLNTLEMWKDRIRKSPVDKKEAETLWDAFNKRWMEMVSPPMFDGTLGTSAQYIYFRRQKNETLPDNSGTTYLQSMGKKYDFVLNEMNGLLLQFIQHIDLAVLAFQSRIQAVEPK